MVDAMSQEMRDRPAPTARALFWCCLAACALVFTSDLFFNGALGTASGGVEAPAGIAGARDVSCLVGTAAFLALWVVGMRRPELLRPRGLTACAAVLVGAGQALTLVGQATGGAWPAVVGMCASGVASAWATLLLLLACSSLDLRRVCLSLAGGLLLAIPLALAVGAAVRAWGDWVTCLANVLVLLAAMLLSLGVARGFFARLEAVGTPADREVSHPDAFLPAHHALFVFILVFSVAYGFAMRTLPAASRTVPYLLTALLITLVVAWTLAHRERPRADGLFQVSFALVVGGFALALVGDARCGVAASAALVAGYMCFYLLMWFALCAVATRSAADAVPAICWGNACNYLGILLGALVGGMVELLGSGSLAVQLALAALLCAVATYMLHAFHATSLDATIDGIEPDECRLEVRYVDRLAQRCDELAEQVGLTQREREILALLARGHNARHIEEELSISHNTVKYHARNIYRKIGVHSQQSLIDRLCG